MEFRKYVQRACIPDLNNHFNKFRNKAKGPQGASPFDHKTVTNGPR